MAIKKLTEAGFKDIDVKSIEGGIINYYYLFFTDDSTSEALKEI